MNKTALIILFNHNHEDNLELLDTLYASRFSNTYYIMPFYSGEREDIISVYENSHYFQGYIVTALNRLKAKGYDYYFIIADDLYLNPEINEHNFKEYFKVDEDTAFIPGPFLLNDVNETKPSRPYAPIWNGIKSALNFRLKQPGINVEKFLPTYIHAQNHLKRHKFDFTPHVSLQMFYSPQFFKKINTINDIKERLSVIYSNIPYIFSARKISYPLIGSYSDILIINHRHVNNFILYCGAFSALNLFVEIAIPSALAYAYPKIISEEALDHKGETYWYYDHHECCKKYQNSLNYLHQNFPKNTLYVHPIKLSKWK